MLKLMGVSSPPTESNAPPRAGAVSLAGFSTAAAIRVRGPGYLQQARKAPPSGQDCPEIGAAWLAPVRRSGDLIPERLVCLSVLLMCNSPKVIGKPQRGPSGNAAITPKTPDESQTLTQV